VVLEGGGAKNMMRYNVADVFLVELAATNVG
jgi:hypothetical protein